MFGRGYSGKCFCEVILIFPVVQEMSFSDISYLQLCRQSYWVVQNYLSNVGKVHYEEHFCDRIRNLDSWLRRLCRLKIFLIAALVVIFLGAKPFCQFGRRHYEKHVCEVFFL